MKKAFALLTSVLFAAAAFAQQPQTQTAPLYSVNAKYVNGVAPGYRPTAGSGLTLNVSAGTAFCGGAAQTYAGGSLTMTASTTNYVYLNTSASCAPAVKTTAFTSADIPVATVVAGSTSITSVTDDRTMFQQGSGGAGNVKAFGAKGDARMVSDAAITAASSTLTSATAAFSTADVGKTVSLDMGAAAVTNGTYTSGITATGTAGQTCLLTAFNGAGSSAAATVYLTGTNTIAGGSTLYFTAFGTGYTSAPTSATAGSGTATCSGTATVATTTHPLPVRTTISAFTNSTTVSLATTAATTISGAFASIGTDDTAAITSTITQACTNNGSVYLPSGDYLITGITIPCALTMYGDGVTTTSTTTGGDYPNAAPYLLGSVLWMTAANTDAVQATVQAQGVNLHHFGVVFDPAIAFWQSGNGFNATVADPNFGMQSADWSHLMVWGTDGNHYGVQLVNSVLWTGTNVHTYGGGGLNLTSTVNANCCAGNVVLSGFYGIVLAGGTATGINVSSAGSNHENLITMIRPQVNTGSPLAAYPWTPATNGNVQQLVNIPSTIGDVTLIAPDLEGNASVFKTTFPYNSSFVMLGAGPGNAAYSWVPVLGPVASSAQVGDVTLTDQAGGPSFSSFDQGILGCGPINSSSTGFAGVGCLFGNPGAPNDGIGVVNSGGTLYFGHLTSTSNSIFGQWSPTAGLTVSVKLSTPFMALTATQSTVSCSTSGSVTFSQPLQGSSDKKVIAHLAACNGTASYTFPTAYTNTPGIFPSSTVSAALVTALSTAATTITGSTSTGTIILEDY